MNTIIKIYKAINKIIEEFIGAIIYRITGDKSQVDWEYQAKINKLPTKKERQIYLTISAILLVAILIVWAWSL